MTDVGTMGRFTLGVSMVIAASGCADVSPPERDRDGDVGPMGEVLGAGDEIDLGVDRRPAPMACGVSHLAAPIAGSLSVASSPAGAKVFGLEDGNVIARSFDRGELGAAATKLRANVTHVAAAYAGGDLVLASTSSEGAVFVDLVDPALDKATQLVKLDGDAFARTPIVRADEGWLVPTVDRAGLTLAGFDRGYQLTDVKVWETTKPATAVAASGYSTGGAVVGWSTVDECHLAFAPNAYTTVGSTLPHACANLQVAADRSAGGAMVVFETAEGVMFSTAPHHAMQPAQMLRHAASAPKLAYDGRRYWVGFLDMRGQVIVGYYEDGAWTTSALPAVRPDHDAFDLAIVDGMPYLIAGDAGGYASHRICTQ